MGMLIIQARTREGLWHRIIKTSLSERKVGRLPVRFVSLKPYATSRKF